MKEQVEKDDKSTFINYESKGKSEKTIKALLKKLKRELL